MGVQLVVLDMAGTTVEDDNAVNRAFRGALQAAGAPVTEADVNGVMGLAKPVAIRLLLGQTRPGAPPAEDAEVEAIHRAFKDSMIRYYETDPSIREVRGAADAFRRLRGAGMKVVLDTGFSRPIVDAILRRLGWLDEGLIDASVASDEVARGRPAPDMILRAMELTGVTDVRLVAKVGDTPADLNEGTAAGCGFVIGVTEGTHSREELEKHPHTHLIASVAELPALLGAALCADARGEAPGGGTP